MPSPVGHTAVGVLVARRLGVTSKIGLAGAGLLASLPDADIALGLALHRDAWKLHRQGMHSANFALTAGALLGVAGLVRAGDAHGERDLVLDALTGAAIVGSHVAMDALPIPAIRVGPKFLNMHIGHWILDSIAWSVLAWLFWPRARRSA